MSLAFFSMDLLWRNALGAIPLAIAVAAICRWLPCRPSTRHALWLIVLLSLLAPPILPRLDLSAMLPSIRPIASAPAKQSLESPKKSPEPSALVSDLSSKSLISDSGDSVVQAIPTLPPPTLLRSSDLVPNVLPALQAGTAAHDQPIQSNQLNRIDQTDPAPRQPRPEESGSTEEVKPARADLSSAPEIMGPLCEPPSVATAPQVVGVNAEAPTHATALSARAAAGNATQDSSGAQKRAEPSVASSISIEWREWFLRLFALRDAIASLAPIPTSLWLGGSALLIIMIVSRVVRFRRLLRNAVSAPQSVRKMVDEASREIGLKAVPTTLVVQQRISPLVWCGRQRLLLLPQDLWSELDNDGRSAVLLHELAHLRRRDHWICWAELLIGCLYWWHPMVWWIRRRLRDEADLCCDAWVTSLLPGGRRAYARALLTTRQYISREPCLAVPAVGLGATTLRAKRFARRLTMVMTERTTPRLSILGSSLALCLATAAWLATPIWACPPGSNSNCDQKPSKITKAAPRATAVPMVVVPAPHGPASADNTTTFEAYMSDRDQPLAQAWVSTPRAARSGDGDVNARLDHLEQRLDRLTEQLERMMGGMGGMGGDGPHDGQPHGGPPGMGPGMAPGMQGPAMSGGMHPSMAPRAPQPPRSPQPPQPPQPPQVWGPGAQGLPGQGGASAFGRGGGSGGGLNEDGQTISRTYHLPSGKLEALVGLMSRSDVPVLINQVPDGIEVHATPRQHEIFGAFVHMINPGEQGQGGGKGEGGGSGKGPGKARSLEPAQAEVEALHAYSKAQAAAGERIQVKSAQVQAMLQSVQSQRGAIEQQVRRLNEKAQELRRKAQELQEQAGKLHSQADKATESDKAQIDARADGLEAQADAFESEADAQDGQIEAMQAEAESLQEQFEQAIEQVQEEAQAAAEAAQETSQERSPEPGD